LLSSNRRISFFNSAKSMRNPQKSRNRDGLYIKQKRPKEASFYPHSRQNGRPGVSSRNPRSRACPKHPELAEGRRVRRRLVGSALHNQTISQFCRPGRKRRIAPFSSLPRSLREIKILQFASKAALLQDDNVRGFDGLCKGLFARESFAWLVII
jgi:hypothetical protein